MGFPKSGFALSEKAVWLESVVAGLPRSRPLGWRLLALMDSQGVGS